VGRLESELDREGGERRLVLQIIQSLSGGRAVNTSIQH
jgi:hypothetical protein